MVLVGSGLKSEQVSLMRPIFYTEKYVLVLKQVDLIVRKVLISSGLRSGTLLYYINLNLPGDLRWFSGLKVKVMFKLTCVVCFSTYIPLR